MADNSNQNQKLTPKQKAAIAALVDGQNYEQAAMTAGVSTRTIARWRELDHFEQALQRAGQVAMVDATRQLTAGLETAISFLLAVIVDTGVPPSVRVRAALGLIDRQIRLKETTELLERVAASLEARL